MAHPYIITRRILFSLSLSLFKEVFLASFFVVLYLCVYCLFDFHDLFLNYVLLFAYSWLLRQLFRSYVSDACLFIVLFSYDLMTYAMPGVHSMLLFFYHLFLRDVFHRVVHRPFYEFYFFLCYAMFSYLIANVLLYVCDYSMNHYLLYTLN